MLSSDKNIENIVQLIEALKEYFELKKSYLKYDVVDKVVRLTAALALTVIILLLTIAVLFYASFALVYWMSSDDWACRFGRYCLYWLVG